MKSQILDRFPGVSCAYMDATGKETTEFYGVADKESRILVDGDTIFPACSISKFITTEVMNKVFEDIAKELIFDKLSLKNTFFGTLENINYYEENRTMATGYQGNGSPIPRKYPSCPDLAAAGLWSTPKELLLIARDFLASLSGEGMILGEQSACEMIRPIEQFPWTGLGLFIDGTDSRVSKGWGEGGQCMLKMNICTHEIAVVMANKDPQVPQEESGIEKMLESRQIPIFGTADYL